MNLKPIPGVVKADGEEPRFHAGDRVAVSVQIGRAHV